MKIKLETLQHQVDALKAIDKSFCGIDYNSKDPDAKYIYANPLINSHNTDEANIDIKMETGTGKTYVYTRMMYDLHQKYGLFKFVIAVPSPSIKEGTKNFINSDYSKQHFSQFYENANIQLNVISSGDFDARTGRRNFPPQLSEFIESTRQNKNQIQVLLINAGMLHSKSMHRNDYDQTLLGGETCPIKAIAATRPVVIIDEPHRFVRGKKFYGDIEMMKPQMIVRFGATFPKISIGKGKNKTVKTDYYRGKPQFNLNAIDSFNQGLVKGIDVDYPEISQEQAKNLYKVREAKLKELILSKDGKNHIIKSGDSLSLIDSSFEGNILYEGGINRELSNGLFLSKEMKLIPGTFSESYQEKIIKQALNCHFINEQENFFRMNSDIDVPKIKTLTLFFIDSVQSFSGENGGRNKGWLILLFEKLLKNKLKQLLSKYESPMNDREKEYLDFLRATFNSLISDHQNVYAGYFSQDRGSNDKDIQREVDDILESRDRLLGFKDKNGHWITRRFLFSKWTLREGWDNPNVFVIAKLRSSGSENSKIQEVGRGLRLPVDETGHRLSQDEWPSRLSFLVGYDEQSFAKDLVGEINSDSTIKLNHNKLTDEMIKIIVDSKIKIDSSFNENKLLDNLDENNIINRSNEFMNDVNFNGTVTSGFDAFLQMYPEVYHSTKIIKDRIRNLKDVQGDIKVRLRKSNWENLKDLWLQLSRRQMVVYNNTINDDANDILIEVFKNLKNFVHERSQIVRNEVNVKKEANINQTSFDINDNNTMNYGKFLKLLTLGTDLPVNLLNNLMINAMNNDLNNDKLTINSTTLNNLIKDFNRKFNNKLINNYHYEKLDFTGATSIYDNLKQEFVDDVPANSLGIYSSESNEDLKYLYDRPPLRYDSTDPELKLLKRTYGSQIEIFGKLPKRAIKIPRYDKGTTTPDFIFKIKQLSGKYIYLIVETKAENMRIGDEEIKSVQEKYFDTLKSSGVYYQMATNEEEVLQKLRDIEETKK